MIIGSGSIRVNLSIFGANQYKLPEQAGQLAKFFSLQYFVLKCGSVLGRLLLPVMREDVKCFDMNGCYALSFGATALVTFVGLVVLVAGRSLYVRKPPGGNMMVQVCRCIMVSFR